MFSYKLFSKEYNNKNFIIKFLKVVETSKIVEYEYWMSSMDYNSYKFLNTFKDYDVRMRKYTTFTPHYAMFYNYESKHSNWTKNPDSDDCISMGRYCSIDPGIEL